MLQGGLTTLLLGFCLLAILSIILLWWKRGWLIQWLKGTAGFVLLGLIIYAALSLADLWSYQQFSNEESIATVSVYKLDNQEYDLTLAETNGQEQRYKIIGDQWQLDVRLLLWNGPFAGAGVMPLYRLDRLSGRYFSLEQERTAPRSVYSLAESRWFDLWQSLQGHSFWLDAQFGSAVYMPLSNGAVYSIKLTPKGLLARPLNDVAEEALNQPW